MWLPLCLCANVCECACLYEQKCVVRASLDIFSESLQARFKLSISLEVPSYQVSKLQVSVASLQVKYFIIPLGGGIKRFFFWIFTPIYNLGKWSSLTPIFSSLKSLDSRFGVVAPVDPDLLRMWGFVGVVWGSQRSKPKKKTRRMTVGGKEFIQTIYWKHLNTMDI